MSNVLRPALRRLGSPLTLVLVAVGLILGGLLVGYEPIGGDPDRFYRPVKTELARSLRQYTLPFWSDRFGLGVPLVAESQVAAFYPPNWFLYRLFDVSQAYRLSMCQEGERHPSIAGQELLGEVERQRQKRQG